MAKGSTSITVNVRFAFDIPLWSAIKLRIAGRAGRILMNQVMQEWRRGLEEARR